MKRHNIIATSALLMGALSIPALADVTPDRAEQVHQSVRQMFLKADKNHDGNISRTEYTGTPTTFDRYDLNYDGELTPAEVEQSMLNPKVAREDRVMKLDKDGDGVISRAEFTGDDAAFARFDRNHDGVISDDDKQQRSAAQDPAARFKAMDLNGDGRLTRDEWRGTDHTFQAKDKNSDGVLTVDEVTATKKAE